MRTRNHGRSRAILSVCVCMLPMVAIAGCDRDRHESRESIKSSLPAGADLNQARSLTLMDLGTLPEPPGVQKNDPRYEDARIPAFPNPLSLKEGDVVTVSGWLHVVRSMGDGDYNLRFSSQRDSADHYIVSEIPDGDDAPKRLQPVIEDAREFVKTKVLDGKDPSKQGTTLKDPVYVQITGQLYFNDANPGNPPRPDAQGLQRSSYWEIHPGLKLAIVKP